MSDPGFARASFQILKSYCSHRREVSGSLNHDSLGLLPSRAPLQFVIHLSCSLAAEPLVSTARKRARSLIGSFLLKIHRKLCLRPLRSTARSRAMRVSGSIL